MNDQTDLRLKLMEDRLDHLSSVVQRLIEHFLEQKQDKPVVTDPDAEIEMPNRHRVRTKAEVIKQRRNAVMGGCCERYANHMGCSCLNDAIDDAGEPCGDQWKCSTCGTCNAGKAAKCMGCGG